MGDATACMWHCFGDVSIQPSIMLSRLELVTIFRPVLYVSVSVLMSSCDV